MIEHDEMEKALKEPLPDEIMSLIEKGKKERTTVLQGTERPNKGVGLYAKTHVEIKFHDEENLIKCIKLLRWSDERLSKLPALVAMWDWQISDVEKLSVHFSTGWYDKDFFEARKLAFLERDHLSYYEMFGASADDITTYHEIIDQS